MYAIEDKRRESRGATTMTFGQRLRSLRKRQGLSLRVLATRTDTSPSYISDLERGVRGAPTAPVLERLANGLGVTVDTLLGREPSTTPLLDEAEAAFAHKLRELNKEDKQAVERFLEYLIDKQDKQDRG